MEKGKALPTLAKAAKAVTMVRGEGPDATESTELLGPGQGAPLTLQHVTTAALDRAAAPMVALARRLTGTVTDTGER
jgi:hypothetical protein